MNEDAIMNVQIIETPQGERMAILSERDYLALLEQAELQSDLAAIEIFKARIASGDEELVPAAVVNAILDGANPLRVWREHRGLSVSGLAAKAGVSQAYVSLIESGKREGSVETLGKIAAALRVTIDEIIAAPRAGA
jgi:DNA-binding XRE family transcriptional regulator